MWNAVAADRATEHTAGIETHSIIAFGIQHDQASIAADGSDFRQRIIRCLGNGSVQQPYLCCGIESSYSADEYFSGAGR